MVHCERLAICTWTCVGLHKDTRLTATRRVSNTFQKQMLKLYRANAKFRATIRTFSLFNQIRLKIYLKRLNSGIFFTIATVPLYVYSDTDSLLCGYVT